MKEIFIAAVLVLTVDLAWALGPQVPVKTNGQVEWSPVAERQDGRPVQGTVVYHVYHGTSEANLRLVAEGLTGLSYDGLVVLEGQNYVGVVAEEAGNAAGPSPISELFPFEGVWPASPPRSPVVSGVR